MKLQPYIQQHFFDLEPLRPKTRGFAAFLDVIGPERPKEVFFEYPKERLILDELIDRPQGITFAQNGKSRTETATGGELFEKAYSFGISGVSYNLKNLDLHFKPYSLRAPKILSEKNSDRWILEWKKEKEFSNFWVFVVPELNFKDWPSFFNSLRPITKNSFSKNHIIINKKPFADGEEFRVLVRANQQEEINGFPRFSRESWGISEILT